ncbi:hypothetical protein LINPERHAP2_LOCUS12484 [Linum perenne]
MVYGELLTITPELIGKALDLPTTGAGAEIDYILQSFNAHQALRLIAPLAHSDGSSALPNTVLDDTFRVLHFVLTHLFLPRGLYSEMLLPSDIWILQCAKLGLRISLPHLMFRHMLEYVEQGIPIAMPFAAEVTAIMKYVGLDLDEFVDANNFHPLQAQDVLHAVHSGLALTQTHGSDRGGEMPNTRSGTRTKANARKRTLPHSRNLADKDSDPEAREKGKTIVIDDSDDPYEEDEEASEETSGIRALVGRQGRWIAKAGYVEILKLL